MENTVKNVNVTSVAEKIKRYVFALVDGTNIAIKAHSSYEAARMIREMLRN